MSVVRWANFSEKQRLGETILLAGSGENAAAGWLQWGSRNTSPMRVIMSILSSAYGQHRSPLNSKADVLNANHLGFSDTDPESHTYFITKNSL